MAVRDHGGEEADRKSVWPLLIFSVVALAYFGYQYAGSSGQRLVFSSVGLAGGAWGLTAALVSQVRLSGLPHTLKEKDETRTIAVPSAIVALIAGVGLFLIGR